MHTLKRLICGAALLCACGSTPPQSSQIPSSNAGPNASQSQETRDDQQDDNEFQIKDSETAGRAHGASASKIKATSTHAAMKFFVVDKGKEAPIPGIVISMQGPEGKKYYTGETDSVGYAEVLVPIGQRYALAYLSLGRKTITAKVNVEDAPMQNIKLTLRYKRWEPKQPTAVATPNTPEASPPPPPAAPTFRLDGIVFDTGSADVLSASFDRLDSVVEYMTYKESARIEIAGHTDNVGNSAKNKALSHKRAQACRSYLVDKGIEASRIEAIGYGDTVPVASNDNDEGRQKNRRIEAKEL